MWPEYMSAHLHTKCTKSKLENLKNELKPDENIQNQESTQSS